MIASTKKEYWAGGLFFLALVAAMVRLAIALTAFNPANQPTGYVAQNEVSNFNLKSGNETLFRAGYEKEFYSGNLLAYRINAAGEFDPVAERWSGGAAAHIDAQNFDTGRRIGTMKDNGTGVAFRWTGTSRPSDAQLALIGDATLGPDILNYLRGDRSNEVQYGVGSFHQRGSALGDIVHSRPYYVSDSTNPTIFVGANDGMLHAINGDQAAGGDERWAYFPSMLISKLKNLSTIPFVRDYYVDGQINVGTILSGSKRVLVGSLGAGGKGLYALNITGSAGLAAASEADVAAKVLWEITPTTVNYAAPATANAYANLGYTYGTPVITKVGGVDAVIVGNGYNNGGDYGAYLYVINANTGQRIKGIKAGTNGTVASPNGIFNTVAVDTDNDGSVNVVFAGDLYGTLWEFDLSADTADALHESGQPITSSPAVSLHPNGGYMINFATGAMLTAADTTDTSIFYAYGIWNGAPGNTIVTQTLTERVFVNGGSSTRVRNVTTNAMDWTTDKGWRVALPAGEKVVGEGSYVANQRFYFTAHNPTVSTVIAGTSTTVYGENWLMELDYLSGGNKNQPFLDLSADLLLNDSDRILYKATDTYVATDTYKAYDAAPPPGKVIGDVIAAGLVGSVVAIGRVNQPIPHSAGIPIGKFLDIGVQSQPILVQLNTLNDTLFNQSPDVSFPVVTELTAGGRGVAGGHFDVDNYYYGTPSTTGGAKATATITVGTTGQTAGVPATLGIISLDGVTVFPALTIADIASGTATTTNATTIKGKVMSGFTATVSGSTVTITAPEVGTIYNGKIFTIAAGTSQAVALPAPAVSKIVIGAQPAGQHSRIDDVKFDGSSILPTKPKTFTMGSSESDIASALSAALSTPAGFTKTITTTTVANDTITFTATTNAGPAKAIVVTSTPAGAVAPAAAVSATSKLVMNAQPAGQNTVIQNVTLGGTDILAAARVNFPSGSSPSTLASTLSAALTTPVGFTKSFATTNVANDTIVYTETANVGTAKAFVVTSTAIAGVTGVAPVAGVSSTGLITFGGTATRNGGTPKIDDNLSSSQSIRMGSSNLEPNDILPGRNKTPAEVASTVKTQIGTVGTVTAYIARNAITPECNAIGLNSKTVCLVDTSGVNGNAVSVGNRSDFGDITVATVSSAGGTVAVAGVTAVTPYSVQSTTASATNGSPELLASPAYVAQPTAVSAVAGVSASGWTDFKPALASVAFSGGADGTTTVAAGTACTSTCVSINHVHEYDDKYDRTGVNYLDGSAGVHDLAKAIGASSTAQFKVLVQNQYLSPAVQLHIGDPGYVYNVDQGYIAAKTYTTSTTLDLVDLPTYTLATIGSLAINMPTDAFDQKDWWGGYLGLPADVRVGLHPTETGCVKKAAGATDGNMFQPINPPASVTATGNGTSGYSGTTPATATGVRHNGAFTLQVISASTANSEIEMSVAGRPEYGWRLKSSAYHSRLFAEWTTFWHAKTGGCYGAAGWTKLSPTDMRPCGISDTTTPAPGTQKCTAAATTNLGTDPKIESFGTGCTTIFSRTGNVEVRTTTCDDGKVQIITKTRNDDGSTTIRTQYTPPTVPNATDPTTASDTTVIIAADGGKTTSGGDERGLQPRTGRISWRELIRP